MKNFASFLTGMAVLFLGEALAQESLIKPMTEARFLQWIQKVNPVYGPIFQKLRKRSKCLFLI